MEGRNIAGKKEVGAGAVLIISVLLTLIWIAGCTDQFPGPENQTHAPAIVIDYSRTGGIAGNDDHLVIFENGQGIYSGRTGSGEFLLDEKEMDSLIRLLDMADFPNMSAQYPAPSPGADYFIYSLSYRSKTVWTETGGVPKALDPVINLMDSYLAGP